MGLTTPCMLENSKAAHRNFTYIPYSIYPTPLHRISKPLKPNPTGVHLLGSGQDTRAYLPMGLTTPCMLENSKAAHRNFTYIPYSIHPTTSHALKAQPDGGTPTRQWAGHPGLPTHGAHHTLYARKFPGCAPELCIYPCI